MREPREVVEEPRALRGRRVLVTRPREQAVRLEALLRERGADVVTIPAIRLEPPLDFEALDEAIRRRAAFRWIIFTSANGVAAFGRRLAIAGLDAGALRPAAIAAIGPATAEALREMGIESDVVPEEYRAEGLVAALRPRVAPGDEVLLVRAAEARDVLPRELSRLGARVTVAPAYRTVFAREGAERIVELLAARAVDAVTFTSPSTVRALMALLPPGQSRRLLSSVVLAAIGPITAATLAEYGLEASVVPGAYTAPALAAALAAHFARRGDS